MLQYSQRLCPLLVVARGPQAVTRRAGFSFDIDSIAYIRRDATLVNLPQQKALLLRVIGYNLGQERPDEQPATMPERLDTRQCLGGDNGLPAYPAHGDELRAFGAPAGTDANDGRLGLNEPVAEAEDGHSFSLSSTIRTSSATGHS